MAETSSMDEIENQETIRLCYFSGTDIDDEVH
jgi:hypothetical protein